MHDLHRHDRGLHFLVESAPDYAIYMLDLNGRVVTWNTGAERLKGYTRDEIEGESFERFFSLDDRRQALPARLLETARREGKYEGEGWGLTNDGKNLIMSNGSNKLNYLDPNTLTIVKTLEVTDEGVQVQRLNELEYIKGEIYANIWHTDEIVRISPRTGKILGRIDLTGLMSKDRLVDPDAVLNGIAYDSTGDRLFVTGKLWPTLFEIKVVHQVHQSQDGRGRRPH